MVVSLVQALKAVGWKRIGILSHSEHDNWSGVDGIDEVIQSRTLIRKFTETDINHFLLNTFHYHRLVIIGADVLDGAYSASGSINRLRVAQLANKVGLLTSIINFSINNSVPEEIIRLFQSLSSNITLICRESVSQSRVERIVAHPVGLSADVAFLLKPIASSPISEDIDNWMVEQTKIGKGTFIGININPQVFGKALDNNKIKLLVNSYQTALLSLAKQDQSISFIFLPHSFSNPINDLTLTNFLLEALPQSFLDRCKLPILPYRAVDVQRICSKIDLIFTGRMHLAILALSQHVPIACITYQDKFEGLFNHFGLYNISLSIEEAIDPGKMSIFLSTAYSDRDTFQLIIKQKLPDIFQLARNNIAFP